MYKFFTSIRYGILVFGLFMCGNYYFASETIYQQQHALLYGVLFVLIAIFLQLEQISGLMRKEPESDTVDKSKWDAETWEIYRTKLIESGLDPKEHGFKE